MAASSIWGFSGWFAEQRDPLKHIMDDRKSEKLIMSLQKKDCFKASHDLYIRHSSNGTHLFNLRPRFEPTATPPGDKSGMLYTATPIHHPNSTPKMIEYRGDRQLYVDLSS